MYFIKTFYYKSNFFFMYNTMKQKTKLSHYLSNTCIPLLLLLDS